MMKTTCPIVNIHADRRWQEKKRLCAKSKVPAACCRIAKIDTFIQYPMNCRNFTHIFDLLTLFAVQYLDSRPPRRARRDEERTSSEPKWRKYRKSTATMCGDILADCRQWSHDFGSLVVECQYRSKWSANQSLIYRLQSYEHSAEVTFIDNTCDTSIQVEP